MFNQPCQLYPGTSTDWRLWPGTYLLFQVCFVWILQVESQGWVGRRLLSLLKLWAESHFTRPFNLNIHSQYLFRHTVPWHSKVWLSPLCPRCSEAPFPPSLVPASPSFPPPDNVCQVHWNHCFPAESTRKCYSVIINLEATNSLQKMTRCPLANWWTPHLTLLFGPSSILVILLLEASTFLHYPPPIFLLRHLLSFYLLLLPSLVFLHLSDLVYVSYNSLTPSKCSGALKWL